MRYLLDTCTAIWFFEGSETIRGDVLEKLRNHANELLLSDVSILEIVVKHQLGKFPLSKPPSKILLPLARKHAMSILPLTTDAVFELEKLPLLHRDPFDRLLIAQARIHGLTLVTPDALIRQYQVETLW
jgi:PIN domain nuclease of toxin-antitoxin system